MRPLTPADVVRGQFTGYRAEPGVAADSNVETFAALRLAIDTPRWQDVPFYIRAGKALPVTSTEVLVTLKPPPHTTFDACGPGQGSYFRFRLSPDVLIAIGARVKLPGEAMLGEETELVAHHHPGEEMSPYERLIGDALEGDAALFTRADCVEAAWRVIDPVLDLDTTPFPYAQGTWGPVQAQDLMTSEGGWHNPLPTPV
jgi:glucose-6-phosphate 1-dehydrogenase